MSTPTPRTPSDTCLTGACPTPIERDLHTIKLSEGSGGKEMQHLIGELRGRLPASDAWRNADDDGASYRIGDQELVFTTDSYVVTPTFFPGGNIGTLAFCGTVNDLSVMGADPIGLSLGLILEEGFPKSKFFEIIDTIGALSKETGIPVVTGDTKVLERGAIDGIVINTSGVGIAKTVLDAKAVLGDHILVSGGVGEHGTALLAKRYELEASITSDSKPLHEELRAVRSRIKQAKDVTRGGLSAILNELALKNHVGITINEEDVPLHDQVRALTEILGIDLYSLACEGRFVCIVAPEESAEVLRILRTFNPLATKIGEVTSVPPVVVQTRFGKKILSMPSGNIVPRIC